MTEDMAPGSGSRSISDADGDTGRDTDGGTELGLGRGERVAAVDCGTNSTRLLIASESGEQIDRRMQITRLGAGVDRTGRLSPEAIARTLAVLEGFRKAMDGAAVGRSLAIATSAVRDASNAEEFLQPAARILGEPPRVLPGAVEGRLSYRGATSGVGTDAGPFLVLDIGGGSTELVAGGDEVVSLDVGCVRVTERFLRSDPPSAGELARAAAYVRRLVAEAAAAHGSFRASKTLIGLAGTVSALGVLGLGLDEYRRDAVHHSRLSRERVGELLEELAAVPLAERRERRGMERERADVLVGGALVLDTVMEELGFGELLVSEADILDGIVAELLDPSGSLAAGRSTAGPVNPAASP